MILGIYYLFVIMGYLVFEMIPINYRPTLIDGRMEASYPSSTTLLVLGVMPTLAEQAGRRLETGWVKTIVNVFVMLFSLCMVCLGLFVLLIVLGLLKAVMRAGVMDKCSMVITGMSMVLSVLSVIYLALIRVAYAVVVTFLLMLIKGMLLFWGKIKLQLIIKQ